MHGYTLVAPQHVLPEEWVAELRAAVTARDDIRAVYWLTSLYETDEGTVAQDELHIELTEPPQGQAAAPEEYRRLSLVIPKSPDGVTWSISPARILADVREPRRVSSSYLRPGRA